MKKLQFTVRSILNQKLIQLTKFFILPALLGPAFSFSVHAAQSEIKIAFIDTGFCPKLIQSKMPISESFDATASVKLDCGKVDLNAARFHGQKVIQEFLKNVDVTKVKFKIYPVVIFDQKGLEKKEYWLKAIDWVAKNKMDMVVAAAGHIGGEKLASSLPGIWFVSSGRITPGINEQTKLFPQNLAPMKNLFLIGDYYDGPKAFYDQNLLYQDQIDYYFPSGHEGFMGTSRAVAEAAAKALNICPMVKMRECLKEKSHNVMDPVIKKKIIYY